MKAKLKLYLFHFFNSTVTCRKLQYKKVRPGCAVGQGSDYQIGIETLDVARKGECVQLFLSKIWSRGQ